GTLLGLLGIRRGGSSVQRWAAVFMLAIAMIAIFQSSAYAAFIVTRTSLLLRVRHVCVFLQLVAFARFFAHAFGDLRGRILLRGSNAVLALLVLLVVLDVAEAIDLGRFLLLSSLGTFALFGLVVARLV